MCECGACGVASRERRYGAPRTRTPRPTAVDTSLVSGNAVLSVDCCVQRVSVQRVDGGGGETDCLSERSED
eukprot:2773485-Prymnesium_polylepis.1